MADKLSEAASKIRLQINTSKTEVVYQPSPENTAPVEPTIFVIGEILKVFPNFNYQGSILSTDNKADKEISN